MRNHLLDSHVSSPSAMTMANSLRRLSEPAAEADIRCTLPGTPDPLISSAPDRGRLIASVRKKQDYHLRDPYSRPTDP